MALAESKSNIYAEYARGSNYIGEEGVRGDFFVKILQTQFNTRLDCYIYNLRDRDGNLGVFFSQVAPESWRYPIKVNDCVLMKMTPKRHAVNTFHGGKETTFNRPKLVSNQGRVVDGIEAPEHGTITDAQAAHLFGYEHDDDRTKTAR